MATYSNINVDDNERTPTLNVLYKHLGDPGLHLECLLNLNENDFVFNKSLSLIIVGYTRKIYSKNQTIPNEINQFIIQYAQLSVLKYEINICKGAFKKINSWSGKYEITRNNSSENQITLYAENIYDKDIAFSVINLRKLFVEQNKDPNIITFNVEPFCIRTRAILSNETKCNYSEWICFQTTNTFVYDIGIRDTYDWMGTFEKFWIKHNLDEYIDINQWFSLFKNIGLNEYQLKRVYYYIFTDLYLKHIDATDNSPKLHKNMILWFLHIDVYRNYDHTEFTCNEWYNFRTIMQRFVFEDYVEPGRRLEGDNN